tara:strand:+ start:9881 stop:10123 length:243 start_codon:yes stop_codon:yes gene_type:complete
MARTRRSRLLGGSRKRLPVFELLTNTPTSSSSRAILNKSRDFAPEILKLAKKLVLNRNAKSFKSRKGRGKKRKHKRTQKK